MNNVSDLIVHISSPALKMTFCFW